MPITVILQNSKGEIIKEVKGTEHQSFFQMFKNQQTHIPISCQVGMCGICKTEIIKGENLIQHDKIMPPIKELQQNKKGQYTEIFTCIAGIKKEFINSNEIIILQKNI